jgi:hypothetical protein
MSGSRRGDGKRRAVDGVFYARAADGHELPVVDVTHAAFAPLYDEDQMADQVAAFARSEKLRAKIPTFVQRAMLRVAARRSRLAHALYHASDGVVGGMTLYAAKLGPSMLGSGYPTMVDRKIAAAPPSWLSRIRLGDMARLLADGLAPVLKAKPGVPLQMFNIAGGPAADSWNALLLLRNGDELRDRKVAIAVLDLDEEGPTFGARAIAALRAENAPLSRIDVTFRRVSYDWSDANRLRGLLEEANAGHAVLAVSSEGGLFEYGSDADIVGNLSAVRDAGPHDAIVVGSVTRADGPIDFLRQFTVRPRTLAQFRALAERGGWSLALVLERALCYDVLLKRAT